MAARAAFLLLPICLLPPVFAQAPAQVPAATTAAPSEVDQALRSRVTEFFQDFIDGKFRQALKLVAEDTQDEYFASPKLEIKSFSIDHIVYAPDFTKATVTTKIKRVWKLKAEGFLQDILVDNSMDTAWKVEDGQWVWTQKVDPGSWITPMGGLAGKYQAPSAASSIPDKINDDIARSQAGRILDDSNTKLSANAVTLSLDGPSSAKVVFHNGRNGSVNVVLVGLPPSFPGFSAQLDKRQVNAGEDATVEINYTPPAGKSSQTPIQLGVDVEPFNQIFPIVVDFKSQQ